MNGQAGRCTHDIILAERNMIAAALKDPRNERFILLSETCLPVYPPVTLYLQLISEKKSRLSACAVKVICMPVTDFKAEWWSM